MKLSTGQVSKLFDISKDTLRHYDKLGILKPEVNKSNGYRYYSQEHIDQLNLILAAKDLDISLSAIKETIESENLSKYKNLIDKQERLIKEKIENLKRKQKQLSKWNETLETIINFKNEYKFDNLEVFETKYKFYGVEMKKVLEKSLSKQYASYINENIEVMGEECYYTLYSISRDNEIKEDESIIFIKEEERNKHISKKYIKEKLELKEKKISGKFVCVNFYGNSKELDDYLTLLNKYFNSEDTKELFIKCDFYIPKKSEGEKYFVEILLNIK
ncbi:MerR family transcriptional regulator [Paraclostridium sordellii]|uniref:MerR family transcriptional regulator n=1 Tax=Paraclostridium sordellii TaxID=1505 RepID=UPI0005E3526B|nr:MerR family transcriptional regulator [Paeniclostridium sordellii]CEQ17501.1 transcriptional regulator [[Clostridium] sordellii] [Paeniclostridium sordellii]CEQ25973.1 transcriptional regulator [[Clostridium] sordellii] [Paeniclostridium sordellii]